MLNITTHGPSHSEALVDAGIVAPLVNLLVSPGGDVVIVAVGTLAKIFRNDPELRGCIVEAGVIAPLLDLIQPNASVFFYIMLLLRNKIFKIPFTFLVSGGVITRSGVVFHKFMLLRHVCELDCNTSNHAWIA